MEYIENILDIKPNVETVIIGTLFKEMADKPCVLTNLLGVLETAKPGKNYCSENDTLVVEDSSGRIKVKPHEKLSVNSFCTGTIVALRGQVDLNGLFICKDFCYAGTPFSGQLPASTKLSTRKLFDEHALSQ